ncbi:MAG: SDR family NAD(P)-dependent oxidoreductase [Dehalococcoidales bacterium]|nr:SDR family NAD(P)-dependent oxidoreductase [Dehalococcoidales bacterium]
MPKLLVNRVAVVTGAGSGIGRAEAIGLARQGAKVVVNDIGTSAFGQGISHEPADAVVKEIKKAGNTAVACYDSVATEKGAENIIQTAIDSFGQIDILINNAGVVKDAKNVADISTNDWDLLVRTHLYGTFFCTRRAASLMKKQGYGRIINTSSHVGLGWKGLAPYATVKEGIIGFTRVVARDMAEYGVTCNAIRPIAAWRGAKDKNPRVEVNRPEDIAALVVYLASQKADHINGCVFEVWRGHVGIFTEPPPVREVLKKDGAWTTDELAEAIPQTLTKGRSREKFTKILEMF